MYNYNVRILEHSPLLKLESKISNKLTGCSDVIISSINYVEYEECEKKLISVMNFLGAEQFTCSNISCILLSKRNEALGLKNYINIEDGLPWDEETLLRSYLADSAEFKQRKLNFYILGQIRRFQSR
jgi:hypothetical protein